MRYDAIAKCFRSAPVSGAATATVKFKGRARAAGVPFAVAVVGAGDTANAETSSHHA